MSSRYVIYYYPIQCIPESKLVNTILLGEVEFEDITEFYKKVYTIDATDLPKNDESELQNIYKLLNSDNNPLHDRESQEFIRQNNLHTSMSVGDVIQHILDDEKSRWYSVAGTGFHEITAKR